MPAGRPPIVATPEEFADRAELYFAEMEQEKRPITVTGLALALGFNSRNSLYDYELKPEFSGIVKTARLRVENAYEQRLADSKPTGAIFALKNMGWRDNQTIEHTGRDGGPIALTAVPTDELRAKAAAIAGRVIGQIPSQTGTDG